MYGFEIWHRGPGDEWQVWLDGEDIGMPDTHARTVDRLRGLIADAEVALDALQHRQTGYVNPDAAHEAALAELAHAEHMREAPPDPYMAEQRRMCTCAMWRATVEAEYGAISGLSHMIGPDCFATYHDA